MVAWSWSELAVNGIKDSPKKESEILIKMFHIIMFYDSLLLIKRKWMENIVLDMLRLRAQYFFAKHLSPITIFWKKSDKLLVIKGTICVTDG